MSALESCLYWRDVFITEVSVLERCLCNIHLQIDNLNRVSIRTKIVTTFDVKRPIHGTTYGVRTRSAFEAVCLYLSNLHCVEPVMFIRLCNVYITEVSVFE